jgi:hypothetical protein
MSTPKPHAPRHDQPTPDDLAGVPVCQEEDQPPIRVRKSRGPKVRGRGSKRSRGATPAPAPPGPPTADDLAGIPVLAEGEEDLTIRPWKPRPQL